MTIAAETDETLDADAETPTVVVVPVGVGSLAHSIVQWYAPGGVRTVRGAAAARIVTAEPETAQCLHLSLACGEETPVPGSPFTVMAGLNCGTVSPLAWPDLKAAIKPEDAIVVNDAQALQAVDDLASVGISAGPCGAATLAAIRKAKLDKDDVVVLICTEGKQ
jgi:diaminopropionate ammonia-lyase